MSSVLQQWVMDLGLRHQGALLTAVRGCDTAPKDDASKLFIRCYRETILNAHCGDSAKAKTFIEKVKPQELRERFKAFRRSCDHYPHHYIMHIVHCVQIVGYKHPDTSTRLQWNDFYYQLVFALHLNVETEPEMDRRLNADEDTFAARDHCCDGNIADDFVKDPVKREKLTKLITLLSMYSDRCGCENQRCQQCVSRNALRSALECDLKPATRQKYLVDVLKNQCDHLLSAVNSCACMAGCPACEEYEHCLSEHIAELKRRGIELTQ